MTRAWFAALLSAAACGGGADAPDAAPPADAAPAMPRTEHSSSIAVSADGATIYVVNADGDSVSELDVQARTIRGEVILGSGHPTVDAGGAYAPSVMPRQLALSPNGKQLYVTGQRSGMVYGIDLATHTARFAPACSEPYGIAVSADGARVFVACAQDAKVMAFAATDLHATAEVALDAQPWSLAWTTDQSLAVTHFLDGRVTLLDVAAAGDLSVHGVARIADVAPRGDRRLAHGEVRGLYDAALRPGTTELWVPHLLLGTDTPQPALDFESTAFPALSVLRDGAAATISVDASGVPGVDGAFGDIVSGPHALAFTSDGAFALVVDANSEDVLAVDARARVEAKLLRPLPGHQPEAIALSPDGAFAYIDERNTSDVAVVRVTRTGNSIALAVDGAVIPRFASDPMPAQLRLGQHLFYSANSDEHPITQNHWMACASCHLEGRSDAVTWRFVEGPRDTPSNAGGMLGTGFLFRDAERTTVQDYWHTIVTEQGGAFGPVAQAPLLDALAAYVNLGIPLPIPPSTDAALVARGRELFNRPDVGCATCHAGPRFTDSGAGNPTLDLAGPLALHDVGTCVTAGPFPDVASHDVDGHPRQACLFDTPSLSGLAASPPYLHDGSAPTIRDVLERTRGRMGDISSLSAADEDALVEYLRSL